MEAAYSDIERYLAGEMGEEEAAAFSVRLADEPALRAELALHRRLEETFADPGEVALRTTLHQLRKAEGIRDTPATARPTPPRPRQWPWWAGGLLFLAAATWLLLPYLAPATAPPGPPPALEALLNEPPASLYDFSLEARKVTEAEATYLRLEGDLYANRLPADSSFLLQVYGPDADRYPSRPLISLRFYPKEIRDDDVIAFGRKRYFGVAMNEKVALPGARHYFTVREDATAAVLFAGVVRVE